MPQRNTKHFTKTIHTVEFGKYSQEWELSFDRSEESCDNVKVVAHNYKEGKFLFSNDITSTMFGDFLQAMIDSVDPDEDRPGPFDDMEQPYSQQGPDALFELLADISRPPQLHPVFTDILSAHGIK